MGRKEIELAEINLAVAPRLFDNTIESAGRIMRARLALQYAEADSRHDELSAVSVVWSASVEYGENLLAAGNANGGIWCCAPGSERSCNCLEREAVTG